MIVMAVSEEDGYNFEIVFLGSFEDGVCIVRRVNDHDVGSGDRSLGGDDAAFFGATDALSHLGVLDDLVNAFNDDAS